jgi:cysteine-rich repeat protein
MKKNIFRVGVGGFLSGVVFTGCIVLSGDFSLDGDSDGSVLDGNGSVCEGNNLIVAGQAWQGYNFVADDVLTSCTGARFVRYDENYNAYVGVSLCSAEQYKIFMSDSLDGTFHQLGDWAGGGQDHCELLNPNFTIPNEDDITSGCSECSISDFQMWDNAPLGTTGYVRGYFGEPFELTTNWEGSMHTAEWYQCGVSFDADCGGNTGDGSCGAPEVNVVSVYESNGDHSGGNHPNGTFSLHVDRLGPQILVLASYEPITWTVTAAEGTEILEIVASGYHAQTVNAPAGIPIDIVSYDQTGNFLGCAYEYPDQDPTSGCETPDLFAAVEAYLGTEITSFNGCYQMSEATLNTDLSASGNCSVDQGYSLTGYVDEDCTNGGGENNGGGETGGGCGGEENICGDGLIDDFNEECDDGNHIDGDGCDAFCFIEPAGEPGDK